MTKPNPDYLQRARDAAKNLRDPDDEPKPLVVLDPGHGKYRYDGESHLNKGTAWIDEDGTRHHYSGHGKLPEGTIVEDYGAVVNGVREEDINLSIAYRVKAKLEAKGYAVAMTRDYAHDVIASRYEARIETGNNDEVLHLAIHSDSNSHRGRAPALGLQAYYSHLAAPDSPSPFFATMMGAGVAKSWRRDAFMRSPIFDGIPAACVEVGNMRNRDELRYITSDAGQDALSSTIADRLDQYYLSHKHPPEIKPPTPPAPVFDNVLEPHNVWPTKPALPRVLAQRQK